MPGLEITSDLAASQSTLQIKRILKLLTGGGHARLATSPSTAAFGADIAPRPVVGYDRSSNRECLHGHVGGERRSDAPQKHGRHHCPTKTCFHCPLPQCGLVNGRNVICFYAPIA